jgi:hypothetical protein
MVRLTWHDSIAPEMSPELLAAMREVDAMLPNTPPIAPQMPAVQRRVIEAEEKRKRFIASLIPPTAHAAGVWPRCQGAGGCGYHHRKGIPCGQALNERRPPPPTPMRTSAPGPGVLRSR